MSMSKNIARLAVTAGLTAALSFGGVMAPVTMAFADGTPTVAPDGNVNIDEKTYTDTTSSAHSKARKIPYSTACWWRAL